MSTHSETLRVTGMDCADCARHIEEAVGTLPGVRSARVNFALATLHIETAGPADLPVIQRQVRALGYGLDQTTAKEDATQVLSLRARLAAHPRDALTVASGLFLAVGLLGGWLSLPGWAQQALYALAIVAGGAHVARSGLATLRATRSLDMNALMTIAAVGALAIGEGAEGATAMFLFAVGNMLEGYTMERARSAIRSLMRLAPDEAHRLVREKGETHQERVPVTELLVGDHILVRPGERVPMDGEVVSGESAVNQSAITGESLPVDVATGSQVYAGSINGSGALEVRVTRLAQDATIARIIRMVAEAQEQRAPSQRFVDAFARRYTPAVIVLAAAVAIVPPLVFGAPFLAWFYRALVLLVIACPCALVISTPVSIVSALATAARHGVLIKGGAYLEAAGNLKAIAFDKTGTLTQGRPTVTDVVPFNGLGDGELLALAASVESASEHPLAHAIVHEARHQGLTLHEASGFVARAGRGAQAQMDGQLYRIGNREFFDGNLSLSPEETERLHALEAEGKTVMLLADDKTPLGLVAVSDSIRPEVSEMVAALHRAGIARTVLLTGDNSRTAAAIARQAGMGEARAQLLPEQKVNAIAELLEEHDTVGMVGDGVNDAPALARATIGIAMGGAGTAQALETADIALMSDDLSKLPFAIRLSRAARAIVQQNIILSLGIKALFLALALPGWATLWMAVFADVGASLLVTLNGMRLLRFHPSPDKG
ncbi:MAG: cadmium-translocating P-type ATPase [Anaerolineae bacterium]|nr:cadmium-translocating P-type ATPase [Anaerolineae bacterium]